MLARFGREDGAAPLAALLEEEGARGFAAVRGLAAHSSSAALAALEDGLRKGGEPAVLSADALARGATPPRARRCSKPRDPDPRLRYHALQAAASLACLPAEQLVELASADADADVRELAERLRVR